MQSQVIPVFETPSLTKRLKSMLGVDFYRLFHTPMFYIFLAIAAIIPAMVSSMGMMAGPDGTANAALFTNVWNIVAADSPLYVVRDIGEYANMNMVFIFGGIMVSIFIGHDYRSGYVKQLFTTHAKKSDYMISKSLVCAFAMACMCGTYLLGGLAGGICRAGFPRQLFLIADRHFRQGHHEPGLGQPVHLSECDFPTPVWRVHYLLLCAWHGHSRHRRGGAGG